MVFSRLLVWLEERCGQWFIFRRVRYVGTIQASLLNLCVDLDNFVHLLTTPTLDALLLTDGDLWTAGEASFRSW